MREEYEQNHKAENSPMSSEDFQQFECRLGNIYIFIHMYLYIHTKHIQNFTIKFYTFKIFSKIQKYGIENKCRGQRDSTAARAIALHKPTWI